MLFTALDHPAIACFDVAQLAAWYCEHLGMRIIQSDGKTPPAMLVGYDADARGGTVIELMPVRNRGPLAAEQPRFAPGLRHLAIRVSSFDEAHAKLTAAGIEFITEPGQAVGGGKIASFRDPEGNELQIVER